MITKNRFSRLSVSIATATSLLFFVSILLVVSPAKVSAIKCPDGVTIDDSLAATCGTPSEGKSPTAGPADPCNPETVATPDTTNTDAPPVITDFKTGDEGCSAPKTTGTDGKQCGKGEKTVITGFNFGCRGNNYKGLQLNPIIDILFAIFRFLSAGVGLIAIGSVIVAGIQYSTARDNPQATQNAIKRMTNTIIGLLLYLFIFAIANFLIPGGLFT